MWLGGQTKGHGHHEPYGCFWFEGERWLSHRWSAKHIHGLDINCLQVDHNCPAGPSSLCVQHVNPETPAVNRELQHSRPGRPFQDLETRRHWIQVQVGLVTWEPALRIVDDIPWFEPPTWLAPFLSARKVSDDCPF